MTKITLRNGMTFDEKDVVNIDEWEPECSRTYKPWLISHEGHIICIVFASNESDALDEACDNEKLDHLQVSQELLKSDYDNDEEQICFLGNASEMFDLDNVNIIELENPKLSFTACYQEMLKEKDTA